MKIYQIWLLQATCSIILIATTCATSTEAAKQRQAEVNVQKAAPTRPLKFGDKNTIKIPKTEVNLPSNRNHGNISTPRERQTRNRPHSRVERISLPTQNPQMIRRYDSGGGSTTNQLVVPKHQQHDIPIVHKNLELVNKPITPAMGQQQLEQQQNQQQRHTIIQTQQPTQHSTTNVQSTAIAKTTTQNNRQPLPQHQRKTTTTRTLPSKMHNHLPLSSRNSNHYRTNNSSIVIHQRSSNNSNIGHSQPLLTTASSAGSQPKTSSNKHSRSNIKQNQSVVSTSSTSIRSNVRKFSTSTAASAITTSSSTTTTSQPPFQLPNAFNIFTPEFWQFLIPSTSPAPKTATTTKKPPKKYKPATPTSIKEEKLNYSKPKTTTIPPKQPERVINNSPKKDDGPFRIALPTYNFLSPRRDNADDSEKGKRDVEDESLRNRFNCPRESEVRFQLFPKICKIDEDCKVWNRDEICCEIFGAKSCVSGLPKPLEETSHSPFFGVIQRKCPSRPLAELWWEVKECETDADCWPRVCCPDGRRRYCRTSQPELNTVPVPVKRSFNYLSEYLECTAPPPPIFDLHPKACTSTLDCFPNVCCQEAGLRHCRPPKKSVLTMLANVFNVDFVKRLTQNIVIK